MFFISCARTGILNAHTEMCAQSLKTLHFTFGAGVTRDGRVSSTALPGWLDSLAFAGLLVLPGRDGKAWSIIGPNSRIKPNQFYIFAY